MNKQLFLWAIMPFFVLMLALLTHTKTVNAYPIMVQDSTIINLEYDCANIEITPTSCGFNNGIIYIDFFGHDGEISYLHVLISQETGVEYPNASRNNVTYGDLPAGNYSLQLYDILGTNGILCEEGIIVTVPDGCFVPEDTDDGSDNDDGTDDDGSNDDGSDDDGTGSNDDGSDDDGTGTDDGGSDDGGTGTDDDGSDDNGTDDGSDIDENSDDDGTEENNFCANLSLVHANCSIPNGSVGVFYEGDGTSQTFLYYLTTPDGTVHTNATYTEAFFDGLFAGNYMIEVLDVSNNGAIVCAFNFDINEDCESDIVIEETIENTDCVSMVIDSIECGFENGSVSIFYDEGIPGISYLYILTKPDGVKFTNATYEPAFFDGLAEGIYGVEVIDFNGDGSTVCITEFLLTDNCPEAPFICDGDFVNSCVKPLTPAIFCPQFCLFDGTNGVDTDYVIKVITRNEILDFCSISYINNDCFRFVALPVIEAAYETLLVVGCNGDGICDSIYYNITIGPCDEVRDEEGYPISVIDTPDERISNGEILFDAFPNPSNGIVSINLQNDIEENQSFAIFNTQGKMMNNFNIGTTLNNRLELDLSHYPKGMYMLVWQSQSKNLTKQIILK